MSDWNTDKGPSDGQVDEAIRVLRAEYYTSIRNMAKDVVEQIKSGDLTDADEVDTCVEEMADSCYWVTYTHANYRATMCSDHDPWDLVDEAGVEVDPKNGMAVLAYYVVQQDLWERLEVELGTTIHKYFQTKEEESNEDEEG